MKSSSDINKQTKTKTEPELNRPLVCHHNTYLGVRSCPIMSIMVFHSLLTFLFFSFLFTAHLSHLSLFFFFSCVTVMSLLSHVNRVGVDRLLICNCGDYLAACSKVPLPPQSVQVLWTRGSPTCQDRGWVGQRNQGLVSSTSLFLNLVLVTLGCRVALYSWHCQLRNKLRNCNMRMMFMMRMMKRLSSRCSNI